MLSTSKNYHLSIGLPQKIMSFEKGFNIPRRNIYYRIWRVVLAAIAFCSVILSPIHMSFLNKVYAYSVVDMVLNVIFLIDWVLVFLVANDDSFTNT